MTRQSRNQARGFKWLTEAAAALGWGIILILAALLGALYLRQASQIAAIGRRVQITQNELESLKRSNADLERRIAEAQALERLQAEADRLGFVPAQPDDIEYIIVPDYPIETTAPVPTATPAPLPEPPPSMREALWLTAVNAAGNLIRGEARE